MNFEYYYNHVPNVGLCRNNLIYTSLISNDKKVFVQWYYNDTTYHKNENQVVDPEKMEEKWERELKYLTLMGKHYKNLVPEILDIDYLNKKIYLSIDGPDFWEQSKCAVENYDKTVPDWREQITEIVLAHKSLNLYKYSMHPSSYFIVDGKLKSINYFFTYHKEEKERSLSEVESHIYTTRQEEMRKNLDGLGIDWHKPQSFNLFNKLCWNSFKTNYPEDFIKKMLLITDY